MVQKAVRSKSSQAEETVKRLSLMNSVGFLLYTMLIIFKAQFL